jgi:hypothetical protein
MRIFYQASYEYLSFAMVFLLSTQSVAETEKPQKILSGKVRSAVEEGKFEANGRKLKEVDGLKKFVYNVFRFI